MAFQYLKGTYRRAGKGLFTRARSGMTRGNDSELKEDGFRLDISKKIFTARVVKHWHRFHRETEPHPWRCAKIRCLGL